LDGRAYQTRTIAWRDFARLVKIPTLVFLFFQKFLNAGLLVISFGTVYMVDVFGYRNDQAILIVFLPMLFGNILGNIIGGYLGDHLNRCYPNTGRIAILQIAFFCSAVMGYLATQIFWSWTVVFIIIYFIWGVFLSFGTGLDRPMIASITPPELRSTAYGLWMSTGDALSSLIFVSLVGWLGDLYGLQPVFLWLLTGVMSLRAVLWFVAYRIYPQDMARMEDIL
jgi:MFS family permease